MRLDLKKINDELAKRGITARLEKGDGYFYFHFGEAADWLDRTVRVRTINSLTLKEWIQEFHRLKALNQQIMRTVKPGREGVRDVRATTRPSGRPKRI
ncbi:MAG: hypothetical protein LAQ30_25350 [Acidobacteriia bacterium]|nr:hypothetical protein [Terriglobia bacterium]